MPKNPRILIVDDDPIAAESLAEFLCREGYSTATAGDGNEALIVLYSGNGTDTLSTTPFGVVITDVNMPRCDGMELLRKIRKSHESAVPIVVTGVGKIQTAVEAIKLGAVECLTKPIVHDELRIAVSKAVCQYTLLAENHTLRSRFDERFGLDNIVGGEYRMQQIYNLIEAVAKSKTTVLIDGDSGTGKTMVAHAIHARSPRRAEPFVTCSCGAIPETLLESELFGHVRGAFTGADQDKPGKILAADGGTLFIDEINSATPALQLKLLRILQEKQFEPVGSTQTTKVDARFLLATNQRLEDLVEDGNFREDLYYRINVVNIHLPPLRERAGDVQLLLEHFLTKYCNEVGKTITGFTDEAQTALERYHWPGNVRELENAVERAVVLSRRPVIDVPDLPETLHSVSVRGGVPNANDKGDSDNGTIRLPALQGGWNPTPLAEAMLEPEKQILLAALHANDWNRQVTARQLNINRTTLYKKIKQYHLDELS